MATEIMTSSGRTDLAQTAQVSQTCKVCGIAGLHQHHDHRSMTIARSIDVAASFDNSMGPLHPHWMMPFQSRLSKHKQHDKNGNAHRH